MKEFTIELVWTKIQTAITLLGGWLGYFVGGWDGMLIALVVLMALDYITGVMCAIADHKLSSSVGFSQQFIVEIEKLEKPITEFKRELWGTLLDHATVHSQDDIRFTFRNGTEIKA